MKTFKLVSFLFIAIFAIAGIAIVFLTGGDHSCLSALLHAPPHAKAIGGLSTALMFPSVTDITRQRAAYDKIKWIAYKLNSYGMGALICNQDYFRSEQVIANGTTQYNFPTWQKTMDSTRSSFPLQQGIADKDLFIGITMSMYLDNRAPNSAQVQLQSYPSYQAFNANTGNLSSLYAFYNGLITYSVDRTVYIPRISTSEFLYIPQTQASSVQNASMFSITGAERLFDPYCAMSGQNTNNLILTIYNTDTFTPTGTNGTQNVVTLYMRGITVQSGADFITAFTDFGSFLQQQYTAGNNNAVLINDYNAMMKVATTQSTTQATSAMVQ